ncbi:MAG: DUF5347 family protein [Plesiomonas sp.]
MAIECDAAAIEMSAGERLNGLNHISVLRAQFFGDDCAQELSRFIANMNDERDLQHQKNKRALSAIFYLANIKSERHNVEFSELTTDEKTALISAMNHFRAVVSLFPRKLSLPN